MGGAPGRSEPARPRAGAPDVPTETPAATPMPPPTRAADSRPQVGTVRAQALASGDPEDLRGLETEAARLESLARELDSRAATLRPGAPR